MAQRSIQCFACSAQFRTDEDLRDHTWHYQNEIAALLARLHEAIAHRGLEPRDSKPPDTNDDLEGPENTTHLPIIADQQSLSVENAREDDVLSTKELESTEKSSTSFATALQCPNEHCGKKFTRQQDLIRHYMIHFKCSVFCPHCSVTFVQASKYIHHKCTTEGPSNQLEFAKRRIEILRADAKKEMDMKRRRVVDATHSSSSKRLKTDHSVDSHRTINQPSSLRATSDLGTIAQLDTPENIFFIEPDSSNRSISNFNNAYAHSSRPLFMPADSSWQSQIPTSHTPLWFPNFDEYVSILDTDAIGREELRQKSPDVEQETVSYQPPPSISITPLSFRWHPVSFSLEGTQS